MARDERRDVVVGRVTPSAASEANGNAAAATDGVMTRTVEDHGNRLVTGGREGLQSLDEATLRRAAIAPPTIGPGAHDVVPIDDPLGHAVHGAITLVASRP
jgi:hypothetical protein